jgi:hypothetical protein
MKIRCALLPLALAGCSALPPMKFEYTTKSGEKIEGTVLHKDDGQSLVQLKYGAVTLTAGDVAAARELGPDPTPPAGDVRLATLARALRLVAAQPWGDQLLQVPATVVRDGTLKNVPYVSLRAGHFEFNVYGDPDAPAGLEIGVYGTVHSSTARRLCLAALKSVLNHPEDRAMIDALPLEGGQKSRAGLVFEVTPPTAPDAFGGWWISVFDQKAVDTQRASDREIALITIPRSQIKVSDVPSVTAWKPHELRLARPEETGDGRVYLRGVHRKDGGYVIPRPV